MIVKPSTRLVGGAFAVLMVALLVPAVFGAVRPDDRAGALGVGAVAMAAQPTHPNDRAGPLGTGAVALEGQPAYWQGERDYGSYTPSGDVVEPVVVPTAEASSGYDWGRIALGAAIVAGLAVVATAVTLTLRQHGGPGRPVPH